MFKLINVIFFSLFFVSMESQELNCQVIVDADRIPNSNRTIFKNLEIAVSEFINNTKWSDQDYEQEEKILCSIFINLSEYDSDVFVGSIQIQSSRPVFNSGYASTVLNYNDKDFSFKYQEFEKIYFNANSFDSNLASVVAFYAYIILGLDADTFDFEGGTYFFEQAQNVVNVAQDSDYQGWKQSERTYQNRYFLVNDILSNVYIPFRQAIYQYYFEGLDIMSDNPKKAKENIKNGLATLDKIHNIRPNSFLTRLFFDAKSDEIVSIFSGGPKINITDLKENLNKISSQNMRKWSLITN